jgi:AraC-like DNA-binding protein
MSDEEHPPLRFTSVRPSARLAPYVSGIELFSASELGAEPLSRIHFAGGTAIVPLSFGDPPVLPRHAPAVARSGALLGPKLRADPIIFSGRIDVVNISFRPGAAGAFVGLSMTEVAGRLAAPEDVWPRALREAVAELQPLPDWVRVARLEQLLLERFDPRRAPRPEVGEAVRLILGTGGQISIRALANAVNLSLSQLERSFKEQVGLTPKLLARQRRAYAVVQEARWQSNPDWAQLAAGCGYADQAHLVREFSELVGLTPGAFARARPNAEYLQDAGRRRHIA